MNTNNRFRRSFLELLKSGNIFGMPYSCWAYNCSMKSRRGSNLKFHGFPQDETLRAEWVLAVGRIDLPSSSSKICSNHFLESDYYLTYKGTKQLKKNSVPSVFDFSPWKPKVKQPKYSAPTNNNVKNEFEEKIETIWIKSEDYVSTNDISTEDQYLRKDRTQIGLTENTLNPKDLYNDSSIMKINDIEKITGSSSESNNHRKFIAKRTPNIPKNDISTEKQNLVTDRVQIDLIEKLLNSKCLYNDSSSVEISDAEKITVLRSDSDNHTKFIDECTPNNPTNDKSTANQYLVGDRTWIDLIENFLNSQGLYNDSSSEQIAGFSPVSNKQRKFTAKRTPQCIEKSYSITNINEDDNFYWLEIPFTKEQEPKRLGYPFIELIKDVKYMKLPNPEWRIVILMQNKDMVLVNFLKKPFPEKVVMIHAKTSICDIKIDRRNIVLLGSPVFINSIEDLEILLGIVNDLGLDDPIIHYMP